MRGIVLAVVFAATPVLACDAPGAGYARLESDRYVVWLKTDPASIPLGTEFALDAVVCAKRGAKIDAIRLDAWMPAHRHGMNSRPSLKPTSEGHWRAEGFLFHMPGRWQFIVELDTPGGRERLTRDLDLD